MHYLPKFSPYNAFPCVELPIFLTEAIITTLIGFKTNSRYMSFTTLLLEQLLTNGKLK